ncbi:MAG: hypothetical protein AAB425_05350, partial [Bdellovibrionota bacterium]
MQLKSNVGALLASFIVVSVSLSACGKAVEMNAETLAEQALADALASPSPSPSPDPSPTPSPSQPAPSPTPLPSWSPNPVAARFLMFDPPDATVGTTVTVTIHAVTEDGTIATGFNQDVTLDSSGSTTGTGLVDIASGVGVKAITDLVAETVVLSLRDSVGTGLSVSSTQNVTFSASSASKYFLTGPEASTVGSAVAVTIRALDAYNNLVTTYGTDVTASASGAASGSGLIDVNAGIGLMSVNDLTSQSVTIALSDTQATGLNVTATHVVTFAPSTATKFLLTAPGSIGTTSSGSVTVKAYDSYNNHVPTYGSDVSLTISGAATGAGLVDLVNGVGTKTIADSTAETVTVGLSDSQATGLAVTSTASVTFFPDTPTKFVLTGPTGSVAGTAVSVTVQAMDAFNNVISNYNTDVSITLTGSASGAGLVDLVNGVGTKSINDTV